MSISAFEPGADVEIDGKLYRLLRKVEKDLWQAEETRSEGVICFDFHEKLSVMTALRLTTSRDSPR
jgi:hypothetical protein